MFRCSSGKKGCLPWPVKLRPILVQSLQGTSSALISLRRYSRLLSRVSPLGAAAPAGLPVVLGAGRATRLAWDGWLGAVLALAKELGFPASLLLVAPKVFLPLRALASGLLVLPACRGHGCSVGRFCPGFVRAGVSLGSPSGRGVRFRRSVLRSDLYVLPRLLGSGAPLFVVGSA